MGLKQLAVKGVKWNIVSTVSCTLIQLLRLAILTRLLEKADFGVVAIGMMVISFTEIFSELGMTVGIIHKQDITENQYSSVYWMNVMMSIVMFGLLWLVSPLLAIFYKEPILSKIIPLFGIQILCNAFGKMFQTIKSKNLEYSFISIVRILSCVVGFICTVVFALLGWGVYSLVWGQIIQIALNQGIYAIKGHKQIRIKFHFNFTEIKDFVKIGSYRLGSQVLDFVSSKIDVFLIGRYFGMDDLGVYNIAKDLIVRPCTVVNSLVSSVGASVFAKIQQEIETVKKSFKSIVNLASLVCIPIYVAAFIFADAIVAVLYAPSFASVAIFIRILALYGIETCIDSQAGMLQVAFGRTDLGFMWTIIRVVLSVIAILIASLFDIYAVAYGQLIISVLSFFIFWYIVIWQITSIRMSEYFGAFREPLFVSVIIGIPFMIAVCFIHTIWIQLAFAVLFFALYFGYYWFFKKTYTQGVLSLIIKK